MKKKILSVMEKTIMERWVIKGMNVQENKEEASVLQERRVGQREKVGFFF